MDRFLIRPAKKARTGPSKPPSCPISWNCSSLRLRAERKDLGTPPRADYLGSSAQSTPVEGDALRLCSAFAVRVRGALCVSHSLCADKAISAFLAQGMDALLLQETRIVPDDRLACEKALKAAGLNGWTFYWGMHPGRKRYRQEQGPVVIGCIHKATNSRAAARPRRHMSC